MPMASRGSCVMTMISKRALKSLGGLAASSLLVLAQAQPLPSEAEYKHLGPATCASSVCHGKVTPDQAANVWLNEYRVWSRDDPHSGAYNVLRSDASRLMAEKLGLSSATTARVCLDCHADNVPSERRGEKFQISDGIGCEACHGGAERWIESHAEAGATHADNLARGMYPTDQPVARARLCMSCHVGTTGRFADHDIMAVGHPRMSFELETFTVNQPAHYHVDEDYLERKGNIRSVHMWATGMVMKARRQLDLIQSELFSGHGLFPELAFFDCHACHHPMNDSRMRENSLTAGLPPGVVRLDDSSSQMVLAIVSVLDPEAENRLKERVRALHRSTTQGSAPLRDSARRLDDMLSEMTDLISRHEYSDQDIQQIRRRLLERSAQGEYRDFTSAEQAFLAVETLSLELGDQERIALSLDAWFESLSNEHDFDPGRFAAVARQIGDNAR